MNFLQENILSRFGCSRKLVADYAPAFKSKAMIDFCERNGIILKHSTPYYPQVNGLEESTNKNIINNVKKMLFQKKRAWDTMLKYALWEDRVTIKKAIDTSPFQLFYGTDDIFPVQLSSPVIKFM